MGSISTHTAPRSGLAAKHDRFASGWWVGITLRSFFRTTQG